MGVTHDWTTDRLLATLVGNFIGGLSIGGLSIGWWVDVSTLAFSLFLLLT